MPRNVKVNSTGLVTSGIYSGWTLAPQLSSPPTVCMFCRSMWRCEFAEGFLIQPTYSTNTSPYPDEVIDRLARAFYPAILACWNSEEGQREFAAWQAEQAHLAGKEKQEVPVGELPAVHIVIVCGFWQGASGRAHPVFVISHNAI